MTDKPQNKRKIVRSLFDSSYIARVILSEYSQLFSHVPETRLLRSGDNDNYAVETPDQQFSYIFRLTTANKYWLTRSTAIEFETSWLDFLNRKHCLVAAPVPRNSGRFVGKIRAPEGLRPFVLFKKMEGTHQELTVKFGRQVGYELAHIHLVSDSFSTKWIPVCLDERWLVAKSLDNILKLSWPSAEDREFLKRLGAEHEAFLKALPRKGKVWGVIGGDFHQGNMFCGPDNRPRFFDFDHCGLGWRLFDLATVKWDLMFSCHSTESWRPIWNSIYEAYSEKYSLNNVNDLMIDTFVEVRMLWLLGAHAGTVDILGDLGGGYWAHFLPPLRSWVDTRRGHTQNL